MSAFINILESENKNYKVRSNVSSPYKKYLISKLILRREHSQGVGWETRVPVNGMGIPSRIPTPEMYRAKTGTTFLYNTRNSYSYRHAHSERQPAQKAPFDTYLEHIILQNRKHKHLDRWKVWVALVESCHLLKFSAPPTEKKKRKRDPTELHRHSKSEERCSTPPYLQWTTTGPASEMLSCLWCTSSRKSSTPPGSLGTPWSGQVLKWYCQTVLSVFPWKEDANRWKQNPSDQNPAKSIDVPKLRRIRSWHTQPATQYPRHHNSQQREQARVLPDLTCQSHHLLPQLPPSHAVVSNISIFTFRSHGKVLSEGDQQQGTFICHTHHSYLVALTLHTSSHLVPSHGCTNLIHPAY